MHTYAGRDAISSIMHLCGKRLIWSECRFTDDTEEWILPKAPKGMDAAGGGGRAKSGSKSKRKKKHADMPASDIGKASPSSAEDAAYANEIMGSDEEYGHSSRSGSSSSGSGTSCLSYFLLMIHLCKCGV